MSTGSNFARQPGIPLRNLGATTTAAPATATAAVNQAAASQSATPFPANPPAAPQPPSLVKTCWRYLCTAWNAIDKTILLLGLILAVVTVVSTFRSADDGRRSREAADWTNDKDYLEYCEQVCLEC